MSLPLEILKSEGGGNVCRNLFGPVDHNQLKKESQEMLLSFAEAAKHKWNFDFIKETPLNGDLQWERVECSEMPSVYHPCELNGKRRALTNIPQENEKENERRKDTPCNFSEQASKKDSTALATNSIKSLKRKQTTITDFYHTKRRIIQSSCKAEQ
ncbi:cyclin-dependent kinase inhibitor 1 [Latimeria chalumnae]